MTNQTNHSRRVSLRAGLLAGACAVAIVGAGLTYGGGAVHMTSKAGGGSTFYVRLSVVRSEQSPVSPPSTAEA